MKEFTVLKQALAAGGRVLADKFGKVTYKLKRRADLLTQADLAAQKAVLGVINRAFPDDGFMAEESPLRAAPNGRMWIIDPLDGTTNYAHTFPASCVSVAFAEQGVVKAGGVYDPARRELFLAVKGRGATLNGRRLRVSGAAKLSDSLLVTGFPYDRAEKAAFYCGFLAAFLPLCHDVRRLGSAALDLCWLAAGRTDGYWEFNLNPWDVAAGGLIAGEAGGRVTDFRGRPWTGIEGIGRETLATNGRVHAEMLKVIRARLGRRPG